MKKKLVVGFITTMLLTGPFIMPATASADSVEELEQQKQELENKSSELNSHIKKQEETLTGLESKKAAFETDIQQLQIQIDEVVITLHKQEQKLEESNLRIEELQKEIQLLKSLIEQRTGKLETQARSVQTDGSASNLIELIVSAESLSDLVGRMGVANQLVSANKSIVVKQESDQIALELTEKEAEVEKEAIETLKNDIIVSKNNLVAQKAEMDDKIIQIAAEYDMTESEKNTFIQEQEVIATQTSVLSESLQKERQRIFEEEQAKLAAAKKAEEEAAAQAEAIAEAESQALAQAEAEEAQAKAAEQKTVAAVVEKETSVVETPKVPANEASNSQASSNESVAKPNPTPTPAPSKPSTVKPNPIKPPASNVNGSGFIRPSGGYTTSPYGYRIHPITGEKKLHGGMDFGGGGSIVAAKSGTVVFAGYDGGWGYYVKIDHGNGIQTLYAHMVAGSLTVAPGQQVSQGQQIGTMGTTGSSTGVHLHFEVYLNGNRVNPAPYLGL